jgi:hypothetical protein
MRRVYAQRLVWLTFIVLVLAATIFALLQSA